MAGLQEIDMSGYEDYSDLTVKDSVTWGGWDVFNSIFRRTNRETLPVKDWAGGVGNATVGAAKNYGSKALSFLTSPTGAMLGGGLISGIASYNQAQEERKAIKQQNKQLAKSITEIQNSKADFTNRLSGQSNTLMNQYAMNNNPNKDQFYATGYLNNTNTLNTGIQSMDNDITKMRSMMQRVPAKNNAWIAALSGAFGGGMGVKAMQNNINTANTSKQYQNWYDTNNLNDYYRR